MEVNYDESVEEMTKFLNENEEIFMDFDFLPEIAAVNVESSLINETDTETTESSPPGPILNNKNCGKGKWMNCH